MVYFYILIQALVLIAFLSFLYYSVRGWLKFAPWVPTSRKDYQRILRLADLKPGEKFYDLGSGSGSLALWLSRNTRGEIIGLESSWPLYIFSRLRSGRKVKFKCINLYKEDLSKADVVYFFGTPRPINSLLKAKLERELKPGAKIISYAFKVQSWILEKKDMSTKNSKPIYFYIKK